jgi:HEAT repeat protein
MMRHLTVHLASIDDVQFERVKSMLLPFGETLIRPLVEGLLVEERARSRERMTAMLIGFGALAKREIERLKNSPNPAVRRTAILLLREFGGSDALPELTELLNDHEQGVQRDAVRAIVKIGTENAYQVLQQALASGTPQSRDAIMQSIGVLRDERAAPLYVYILQHVDHRGQLGWIYARAIDALANLKDPESVPALKEALYRGEWWAPRRTAALRGAAAAALARIGTAVAASALEEAAHSGPRGVRAAARAQLTMVRTRQAARAE